MNTSFADFWDIALPWLATHGLRIIFIAVGGWLSNIIGRVFIERIVRGAIRREKQSSETAEKKREDTLIRIFRSALRIIIWILATTLILSEMGIEVGPIIAAAGVLGLAFGFGAQYVIRDLIAGVFIILENQYRVGDVVTVGDKSGTVKDITLRMTTLRDINGTVHHIPNGNIKTVSNTAKEYGNVNFDLGVAYEADQDHVKKVVDKVGEELAKDKAWSKKIIKAPKYLRIMKFADSSVEFKVLGRTKPLAQWSVTGELRKRLKKAFEEEGIEIPFPHMVIRQDYECEKCGAKKTLKPN